MATAKTNTGKTTKKAPAKRQTKDTKTQPAQSSRQPAGDERVRDRGAWREVLGIGLFGMGLVLVYFLIFDTGSGVGHAVSSVMSGLAGVLRYVIPAVFCWVGVLLMFSARRSLPSVFSVILVGALVLSVCAGVHVFAFDAISDQVRFKTMMNFCAASYGYSAGGAGVLGALLSWPLYHVLGLRAAGTIIVLLLMVVAELVLMRKISLSDIGERARQRAQRIRDDYEQRQQARAVQMAMDDLDKDAEPKADPFTRLENYDGHKRKRADEPEPVPEQGPATILPPVRELEVPKFKPRSEAVRQPDTRPFEAESSEPEPDFVPGYLKGAKKKRASSAPALPQIDEPLPILAPLYQDEDADEDLADMHSFGAQFGGLDSTDVDIDDDEAPFDIPGDAGEEPPADIPGDEEMDAEDWLSPDVLDDIPQLGVSGFPIAKPAQRTAAAMPVAAPAVLAVPAQAEAEQYNYPPIDLLQPSKPSKLNNQEQRDEEKARVLIQTLQSFGIAARLIGIAHGPTVTRFELSPAAGVKVSRITSLSDDIAMNLAAISVRIEAPIPGKAAVGVEVPNDHIEVVPLRDVLESSEARRHPSRLAVGFGRDNAGRYIVGDLAKMPHVLIAGQTGSGKSVCINCIICSILYRATPDEVRLIMIDPKVVELSVYNDVPHLLVPVVTDPKKAASALEWAVVEMNSRYKRFAEVGARDLKGFNQKRPPDEKPMPQIVIIIDELADLMMVAPGEVEEAISRLAQLARAAGIHLVIATQRPSVNVITGVIKANIPSRVAFTVASQVDSRTILDVGGAEKLLGRGDMLFAPSGTNKAMRVQGAWVSDEEVQAVVDYVKDPSGSDNYNEDIIEHLENAIRSDAEREDAAAEYDDLLPQAVDICIEAGQASISMLQRRLRVGYARAGRLIDEMSVRGLVSEADGAKPRNVLISREQSRIMFGD